MRCGGGYGCSVACSTAACGRRRARGDASCAGNVRGPGMRGPGTPEVCRAAEAAQGTMCAKPCGCHDQKLCRMAREFQCKTPMHTLQLCLHLEECWQVPLQPASIQAARQDVGQSHIHSGLICRYDDVCWFAAHRAGAKHHWCPGCVCTPRHMQRAARPRQLQPRCYIVSRAPDGVIHVPSPISNAATHCPRALLRARHPRRSHRAQQCDHALATQKIYDDESHTTMVTCTRRPQITPNTAKVVADGSGIVAYT